MENNSSPYTNSAFEQPWWLDIVAPGRWGEAIVKENEEVVARMPYVVDRGMITMPQLTQTLGPWIKQEYREFCVGNTQLSKQKEIINSLLTQLPKHKSFYMCFDSSNEYILPYRWQGYRYSPSFSYRIDDLSNLDKVYANFNSTVKKNIRSATNKKVRVIEDDCDSLEALYLMTFANQKRSAPGDKDIRTRIMAETIRRGNGKVLTAIDEDGHHHSGAFLLYDENGCYYLLGGSNPEFRSSGAQSLVLWKAIEFAAKVSKYFDFEGSNVEGIENFFRQFGGKRVLNYYVVQQSWIADCAEMIKPRIKKLIGYKN